MQRDTSRDRAKILKTIELARTSLVTAKTQEQRARAITREAQAAIELEQLDSRQPEMHPAVRAAMLRIGALEPQQAIDSLDGLTENATASALSELVAVLPLSAWDELSRRVPSAKSRSWAWLYATFDRGALDECFAFLSRYATVNGPFVAKVFERYGPEAAARFAPLVRALAPVQDDNDEPADDANVIADQLSLLLALPSDEIQQQLIDRSTALDEIADNELYFDEDYDQRDPRSMLVVALCSAGELSRARAMFARIVRTPVPWAPEGAPPLVTPGLRRALAALSATSTAEDRSTIHRSVHERFASSERSPLTLATLCDTLNEPFATDHARALAAALERDPSSNLWVTAKHPAARAACVAIKREALGRLHDRERFESRERYALSSALQWLDHDDDNVRFVLGHAEDIDRVLRGDNLPRFSTEQWLLQAAQRGSQLAQRAICERAAGARLWEIPFFYKGLPDEVVRALIAPAQPALSRDLRRREWIRLCVSFLEGATEPERERAWPTVESLIAVAPRFDSLIQCLHVVPQRARRAFVARFLPHTLRSIHDARAVARTFDDPALQREIVERAMDHFAADALNVRTEWINAELVAMVSDERAMQWLAQCYGADNIPSAALPPARLRDELERLDLYATDEWLTDTPSRLLVAALASLDGTTALLERCADACWSLWLSQGANESGDAWYSLRPLVAHASVRTALSMCEHPWTLQTESVAHELALRLDALQRSPTIDPSKSSALALAARSLRDRLEIEGGSPWFLAVRRWVGGGRARSFDAIFRPLPADWPERDAREDAIALGLVDALLSLGDTLRPADATALLQTYSNAASAAALRRARPWIERALSNSPPSTLRALGARVDVLPAEKLVSHWVTPDTRQWPSAMLSRPHLIRALVGDEAFGQLLGLLGTVLGYSHL